MRPPVPARESFSRFDQSLLYSTFFRWLNQLICVGKEELHGGHDKRVPPMGKSEGRACHARGNQMDYPTLRNGPDKQVPPRGGKMVSHLEILPFVKSIASIIIEVDYG